MHSLAVRDLHHVQTDPLGKQVLKHGSYYFWNKWDTMHSATSRVKGGLKTMGFKSRMVVFNQGWLCLNLMWGHAHGFIERAVEGERGRERRETLMWQRSTDRMLLAFALIGHQTDHPASCPTQKLHLWTFASQDDVPTNWVPLARAKGVNFFFPGEI